VVDGIKLTLIPPYYCVKLCEQNDGSVLMASLYMQQEHVEYDQDDVLSEEVEERKLLKLINCMDNNSVLTCLN